MLKPSEQLLSDLRNFTLETTLSRYHCSQIYVSAEFMEQLCAELMQFWMNNGARQVMGAFEADICEVAGMEQGAPQRTPKTLFIYGVPIIVAPVKSTMIMIDKRHSYYASGQFVRFATIDRSW